MTLGPGCLTVDDATTICLMEKPKDLQRRSVLFQYLFEEQVIGPTFQESGMCESLLKRDTKEIIFVEKRREVAVQGYQGKIVQLPSEVPWQKNPPP